MEPKIQKIKLDESQSSSSAAAQIVDSVVDDVLIEIFLRLPMKLLGRFKSVSKHWQSLISNPEFAILRNPNPNPATGLIFQVPTRLHSDTYAYIVSFETCPRIRTLKFINPCRPYDTTTITSSCNGLILMCGGYKNFDSVFDYYVCNPTTNKYFKLPQIPDKPEYRIRLLPMCLAFDPSRSLYYKVVCVLTLEGTQYQFLVYSSETGCWRKSFVEPFRVANVNLKRGVFWNGAIHWLSYAETGKSIYFHLDDDRMSLEIMPTPPQQKSYYEYYFGESCGHLHYIQKCLNWRFDVYEMRSDYSEWFVKYRIHDPIYSVGRHKIFLCDVVRGKSDDESFSILMIGGELVRYNFLNNTHETMCEVAGAPIFQQCSTNLPAYLPLQHAESLCSV